MNKKQAAKKWEVSEYQVKKICKHMGIPTRSIPEDTIPIYIPDGRLKADPHRFYLFVIDVIINTHLELESIDKDIVETCVENLRKAGLIVLKRGKEDSSVDYHDYMISTERELFYNWKSAKTKNKIEMITPLLSAVTKGITATGK